MTDEPRTPLTLEYEPEGLEDDDPRTKPVVIVEPSFAHDGRIFVGIHPLGNHPQVKRAGVHLLPEDARRVMNHLAKLLMESPPEPTEGSVDWQSRIEDAAARQRRPNPTKPAKKRRRRRRPLEFRFEFQLGRFAGVFGTKTDG